MPTRASKSARPDFNEVASRIVSEATEGKPPDAEVAEKVYPNEVSRAAAALSKLGASKGGKARAASMTAAKRKAIAKKAAAARWKPKG